MGGLSVGLCPEAFALRPMRLVGEELREYEAVTFPRNPWSGCELYLRRCQAFGMLKDDGSGCLIDILNAEGDIIQDYPTTRQGLAYLRRVLRFRRVHDEEPPHSAKE